MNQLNHPLKSESFKAILEKKFNRAKNEYNNFQALRTEAYRLVAPSRNGFVKIGTGQDNTLQIVNDRPVTALKEFAANVTQLLCPSGNKFFNLKSNKNLTKSEQETLNLSLAPLSDIIFNLINDSNFYQALNESCIDLGIGTGAILVTDTYDSSNPIKFTALDMSKLYFTEDETGLIGNVFRDIRDMPLDEAQALYPKADFSKIQGATDKVSFIEGIVRDIPNKRYIYVLFDMSFNLLFDIPRATNPFIVFRWGKLSNEQIGRGIILDKLGSIRVAQQMYADILTQAKFIINPPLFCSDKTIMSGKNSYIEAGLVYYSKPTLNGLPPITPINVSGSNIGFATSTIDALNSQIDDALMVNILNEVGGSTMTATEVEARIKIAANLYGAAFGRLQKELLEPVIGNVIHIAMSEKYKFIAPDSMKAIQKARVQYSSPVLNIQKRTDINNLTQVVQVIAQLNGANAQGAINMSLDLAKLPQWLVDKLGADSTLFKSTEQIQSEMQQQATAEKLQQLQQLQNQALTAPINSNAPSGTPI